MKEFSIIEKLKNWIAGIAFRVFLWANNRTEEEYWEEIYEQEKAYRTLTAEDRDL